MQNIQHFRLINGEEIVGDIISTTEVSIIVDNPLLIEERRDDVGSVLVLTKYIPFSRNKMCELSKSHIITVTELHPEIIRYYHNSLKFTDRTAVKMVDEINRVNQMMEQIMDEDNDVLDDLIDSSRIMKSNDTKH